MLEVNCTNLRTEIDELNRLIADYDEILLNLFNELKDSCVNWQDGNSIEFEDKIYLEKIESGNVLRKLTDKKEVLNFICDKYSDIGKKIKCNLNGKSSLLRSIDDCKNQVTSIINEFGKIDRSFSYSEQRSIDVQLSKVRNIGTKLSEVKVSITRMFDKIEEIEKQIEMKMNKLEEIKINNFDYNVV